MGKATTARRKSIACALAIVVLAVLFMGESLLPDKMLAPLDLVMAIPPWATIHFSNVYNSLSSDKVLYIHPIKVLVAKAWHSGIPLWEPHILSGYPIIGNAQAGIFYPGILPYILLPGADASDLVALFHLVMAGLGMFGFLRALHCRHLAALLGAVVFMLNTVVIVWLMWDSVVGVMVWLPWTLWAFERAAVPGRLWMVAPGAIAVALIYLAGHLQWSMYAMLALAFYSVFRFIRPNATSRRRVLMIAGVLALLGTAIAAVQLLPTMEYISQGHRGPISFNTMSQIVSWHGFEVLWVPKYYGEGFAGPAWWGPINYNESMIYVGIAPLLLALLAIILRHDAVVMFFAGMGLFGALSSAGSDIYRVLYWIPGFDSLLPQRMRYLVVVSLSVLCALGLDWLLRQSSLSNKKTLLSIIGSVFVIGFGYVILRAGHLPDDPQRLNFVYKQELIFVVLLFASASLLALGKVLKHWGRSAVVGVFALTLIDLWRVGADYQRPMSTAYYYPSTPAIEMMLDDKSFFRVLSVRRDWQLMPNLSAMVGLSDVGGYDSVYPNRYLTYIRQIDKTGPPHPYTNNLAPSEFGSPLVDLLNVKYALTSKKVDLPGWTLISKAGMRVYARSRPMPRAWIASQAHVVSGKATMLERLSTPNFNPYKVVLLERPPIEPLGIQARELPGDVHIAEYKNNHIVLKASLQRPGWLVLSEMFHPGWRATVNGAPATVYRANYLLRAVPLPAGSHRIELTFLPDSFVTGAVISTTAALILIVIFVVSWRAERVP